MNTILESFLDTSIGELTEEIYLYAERNRFDIIQISLCFNNENEYAAMVMFKRRESNA